MSGEINPLKATISQQLTWNSVFTDPILGNQGSSSGMQLVVNRANGDGGSVAFNQLIVLSETIAASGTVTVDLSAAATNVNGASGTITNVQFCAILLPSTAQNATLGSLGSSVTVGAAGSNPASFMRLNSTGTKTVENGGMATDYDPVGWTIDGTHKSLQIVNNDSVNQAKVYVVLGGHD